ncbi:MAG: adenylyltransferase/cytidyltransferase family protein [Bacteroidales bacterium]|nr:adenylyltransferase/cytidyltransferase family protein [Bacteroidales bacterium]
MKKKKVFLSGCFDTLHAGHIAFIEEAASHGEVHIGIGSDETIHNLKGRITIYSQEERKYMLEALRHVSTVTINTGNGVLDFVPDLETVKPDILFVNEDGDTPEKKQLCIDLGIQYFVSKRIPAKSLPARSTTSIRNESRIPFRIDLAGGWLDQPYVSKFHPGPVITISIEPDHDFNDRSGMSSSTRKKAIDLWQSDIPSGDREKLAKILFCYENPPGSDYISGSQDSIGIVMPGINYLWYDSNQYWPSRIIPNTNPDLLHWIESHLCLLPIKPREPDFNILDQTDISKPKAEQLAKAADALWEAALAKDLIAFGKAMTDSFEAQVSMFPGMSNPFIRELIEAHKENAFGWKLSGAGGGGYLVLVTDKEIPGTLPIRIRRN